MFVKRTNNNRLLASILLVIFLVTSILSQSSAVVGSYLKAYGFALAKTKTRLPSDFQFPYEKDEKEEKQSTEDKSIFICLIPDSELFTIADSQEYSFYIDPRSCGTSTQTPLYLFNRTLLI